MTTKEERLDFLDTLPDEQCYAMLAFISGFTPDVFDEAMAYIKAKVKW